MRRFVSRVIRFLSAKVPVVRVGKVRRSYEAKIERVGAFYKTKIERVGDFYKAKLDRVVDSYERKLAIARKELEQSVAHARRAEREAAYLRQQVQRLDKQATLLGRSRRQAQKLKGRVRLLEQTIHQGARCEFGSVTRPVEDWSRRWRETRSRVVLFATKDYGGSFWAWADAINRHTEWAARLVVVRSHQFGYPTDINYLAPEFVSEQLQDLLSETDVIHLKDEVGFLDGTNGLPTDLLHGHHKPIIFTQYGGMARARQDDPDYQLHIQGYEAVVCITPDLCFEWLNEPRYIPHSVETQEIPYTWQDSHRIGHSPSTGPNEHREHKRIRKGTEDFKEVLTRLDDIGLEVDLIQGVPHLECLERKSSLGLFFDQAGLASTTFGPSRGPTPAVGWYGNSGLEAAVRGIPTIGHLSDDAFEGASRGGHDGVRERCAIVNTPIGPDGLEKTIRWYFQDLDSNDRADLSRRTRRWVESFHDARVIAAHLTDVYGSVAGTV